MNWIEPTKIDAKTDAELSKYPPLIRQVLFGRGIRDRQEVEQFLNPKLEDLTDPYELFDSLSAVKRVEEAISKKELIFIHGDFDVDGVTSTAILWEYLYRVRKARVLPYIPSRVDEGYGLSAKSLDAIIKKGGQLVITVDCGIRDAELVSMYRKSTKNNSGVDIIVTDHHALGEKLPKFIPVVHPLHPKGKYPFPYLSGAGVVWKFIAALEKNRLGHEFTMEKVPGLDLVALSVVCDIVPLTGENRIILKYGLEQLRHSKRAGIQEIADESGITLNMIDPYHLGYIVGPRINAAGRIGDATDALRLLTTEKVASAKCLANKIGELNRERQNLTDMILTEVREKIEQEGTGKHLYFQYGEDWPAGIIGIVAGKIQEQYHHPVVLVSKNGKDSRGSARSISKFNIIEAISKHGDMLERYGGHSQAAGFTIDESKIEEFKDALEKVAEQELAEEHFISEITADAVVSVGDMDWNACKQISQLEPYGYGNRTPIFWIKDAVVTSISQIGKTKDHLRLMIKGQYGTFLQCIFFRGGEWFNKLAVGDNIELVGSLEINNWNGKEYLQFNVKDLRAQV